MTKPLNLALPTSMTPICFILIICTYSNPISSQAEQYNSTSQLTCDCLPDFAGPDRTICGTSSGVTIGCELASQDCADLCFDWQQASGLDLNDRMKPNPTVFPTETTIYQVRVINTSTGENLGFFEAIVYVIDAKLKIFKPKVITGNTTTEANDPNLGVQTFVNIDNDDQDRYFDNSDIETHVGGGDDELVKLTIQLGVDLPAFAGTHSDNQVLNSLIPVVRLEAKSGGSDIRIWMYESKDILYKIGSDLLLDATPSGSFFTKDLWVEGINAQNIQKGVELNLYYNDALCDIPSAYLTILGVSDMTWEGVDNNSATDNNALDQDPNLPAGDGVRIYPDSRFNGLIGGTGSKQKAKLIVTLSTPPIETVRMFIKSFDVDDPIIAPCIFKGTCVVPLFYFGHEKAIKFSFV